MSERGSADVCLKWPNDLYARLTDGELKKAAGVLFEAVSQGDVHHVILGLGLNIDTGGESYASLQDLGLETTAEDLHVALHAMVASLFSRSTTFLKRQVSMLNRKCCTAFRCWGHFSIEIMRS